MAAWLQTDGTRFNVRANRNASNRGWGTPELFEGNDTGAASQARLVVDRNGSGIAVWRQSDGTNLYIWANRHSALKGWGVAGPVEEFASGSHFPNIAMDAFGQGIVAWHQAGETNAEIWANRFE